MGGFNICFPTCGLEVTDSMINEKLGITDGMYKFGDTAELKLVSSGDAIKMQLNAGEVGFVLFGKGINSVRKTLTDAGLLKTCQWYLECDASRPEDRCRFEFQSREIDRRFHDNSDDFYDGLCIELGHGGLVERDRSGSVTSFGIRSDYGFVTYKGTRLIFDLNHPKFSKDIDWSLLTEVGISELRSRLSWCVPDKIEDSLGIGVDKLHGCMCSCKK